MMQEYSLTRSQQQILDASEFSSNTVSTLCGYITFDRGISPNALKEAIHELYRRNDSLRIRLSKQSEIAQHVEEYNHEEIDYNIFASWEEFLFFASGFAGESLPLFGELSRFLVFSADGKTGVLLKIHHIISDGWSVNLLTKQLLCILKGKDFSSPPFTDHIRKEADYPGSEQHRRDKAFFSKVIGRRDHYPLLREGITSFAARQVCYEIPESFSLSVSAFCEREKISPAVFWLTCYCCVLSRKMNCADGFFMGLPVLNRVTPAELSTVGMFTNNIPVLIRLDRDKSFPENAIENIEDSFYSALRHQRFNYSELTRLFSNPQGRIFDIVFSYLPRQSDEKAFANVNRVFCGSQIESLQLHIDDTAGKIYYSYRDEVFSEKSIQYFHDAAMGVIRTALSQPDIPVKNYAVLSERELAETDSINNTALSLPEDLTIYDIFNNTCRTNAKSICIKTRDKEYSYSAFEKLVRLVDAEIRRVITGTQKVVAVCCCRSIEMYASVYAILRSGNIFLPVSPDDPKEYTEYILSNAGAALLLTDNAHSGREFPVRSINVSAVINRGGEAESLPVAHGELAYILYTSGSTGRPKGAAIRNISLLNRILWMQNRYRLSGKDVILQKTPYTFDVSLWEIFWWAVSGASMAVTAPYEHYLPQKILKDIRKYKVTHIHFVPSVFDNFLDYLESAPQEKASLSSLRHIYFSGEALHSATVTRFKSIYPGEVKMHNLYGPTECAIDATYYDCANNETGIPIGKPIDNVSAYIVNDCLERVPFGTVGQLALGGVCVGKGYVNDTEATAERFIQNPYGDGNLFLTGDMAYLREDGNIIFAGRRDKQVKINGQRTELSAIESAICSHPSVKNAVVLPVHDGSRTLLRAFYTGAYVAPEKLREHVKGQLPNYMLPHAWNHIKELPLSPHGKIDSKTLLALPAELSPLNRRYEAPESEPEKEIAALFEKVLHRERIGRTDDFFLSGGTSLDMAAALSGEVLSGITAFEFMQDASPSGIAKRLTEKRTHSPHIFESLVKPESASDVLVIFPFAGGDISSFSAFVNIVKKQYPHIMVLAPGCPLTEALLPAAADEIIRLSGNYSVRFYAHCAGIANAMALLRTVEKLDSKAVTECISTGMIPPAAYRGRTDSPWKLLPDFAIERVLRLAGLPEVPDQCRKDMLSSFRRDTDWLFQVLSRPGSEKIKCPLRVLISKNDIFTKNTKTARNAWSYYFQNVGEIRVTEYNTHYYQNVNAGDILRFILGDNNN